MDRSPGTTSPEEPYTPFHPGLLWHFIFRTVGLLFIGIGLYYLYWRWTHSLNPDALWFSIPLVTAESLGYLGTVLMVLNYWDFPDPELPEPAHMLSEIDREVESGGKEDRPLRIDLFLATVNEEKDIVEATVQRALALEYPYPDVEVRVCLCDDGERDGRDPDQENFKALAEAYGITYFSRSESKGYKAGNLNRAFWRTDGDLLAILDADTKLFPRFLRRLTGYFKDPGVAWVQSPQWFTDIPQGRSLGSLLRSAFPFLGDGVERNPVFRKVTFGKNLLGTDPRIFYDRILRSRDSVNASFCCGAGSLHRRRALEALIKEEKERLLELDSTLPLDGMEVPNEELLSLRSDGKLVGPFVHHISEDLYTSILIHSSKLPFRSVQHPYVESEMLSPQTLPGYVKQFKRYAEGTFDLAFKKEDPLVKRGLSGGQRVAYWETIHSYFSSFWILIFLLSPPAFFFTLTPPVKAFNFDFFLRFIAFFSLNTLVLAIANWGISTVRSEQYYISGFWLRIRALKNVLFGKGLRFAPTSKGKSERQSVCPGLIHIIPHLIVLALTLGGIGYDLLLIQKGLHPSYSAFAVTLIWAFHNIFQMSPFIRAAFLKGRSNGTT